MMWNLKQVIQNIRETYVIYWTTILLLSLKVIQKIGVGIFIQEVLSKKLDLVELLYVLV